MVKKATFGQFGHQLGQRVLQVSNAHVISVSAASYSPRFARRARNCRLSGVPMNRVRISVVALALVLAPAIAIAQDKFFDSNGVKIRYVEAGSGPPMLLVHGFGNTVETWMHAGRFGDLAKSLNDGPFDDLAKSYRVIAFDLRGHGKSDKPHDAKQYGPELALDIVRLLDHLDIPRAHVVGYSLGGNVTSQLLTLRPDRLLTATLIAGSGRFAENDQTVLGATQEASEIERECISRSLALRLAPPAQPPSEEELRARSAACFADPDFDRFAAAALARARPAEMFTPAQASAVKVPTLGIVGTLDPNRARLEALKKLRADLKLVTVEGATHAGDRGILRRPELTAAIREFVSASYRETSSQ
jgi:pimeloyl-ACP methyl ester carboxylesterase